MTTEHRPDIVSSLRFVDAGAAVEWLARAFGFAPGLIVRDDAGTVSHAELHLGRSVIMLGEDRPRDERYPVHSPHTLGGATNLLYVAVPDIEAAFARAEAGGARVIRQLTKTDYGSVEFAVKGPGDYNWTFGTYHPTADGREGFEEPALEPEIFAGFRYDDAPAGIAFLEKAFGFETAARYDDGDNVSHAQLRYGSSLLMLGSYREPADLLRPATLGGRVSQSVNLFSNDVDAHFARAQAAGATFICEPADTDYGAREYIARDPEGHLFWVGNYRPTAPPARSGNA